MLKRFIQWILSLFLSLIDRLDNLGASLINVYLWTFLTQATPWWLTTITLQSRAWPLNGSDIESYWRKITLTDASWESCDCDSCRRRRLPNRTKAFLLCFKGGNLLSSCLGFIEFSFEFTRFYVISGKSFYVLQSIRSFKAELSFRWLSALPIDY